MGFHQQEGGRGRSASERRGRDEWTARPWWARLVCAFVTLAPVAVGAAVAIELTRELPTSSTLATTVLRVLLVTVISTALVFAVDRSARRLLPLAALYRLSLVFPDRAPSRFRVALKAGSSKRVERLIVETRLMGLPNDAAQAAERVVEMITAIGDHDRRTRGHSERVRLYADLIGEELHLSKEDRQKLQWAALLHDLGKLKVPGEILNKKGAPNSDEWAILRGHPAAGEWLVAPLRPFLGMWADAVGGHHEWWNGTGYPRKLRGDEISQSAAIVAVADAYEVMTAVRSYKKSMPASVARAELTRAAGVQFSPEVVRAFLCVSIGKLRLAAGPLASLAQVPYLGSAVRFPASVGAAIQGATGVAAAAAPSVAAGVMVATTAVATSFVAAPAQQVARHKSSHTIALASAAHSAGGSSAQGASGGSGSNAAGNGKTSSTNDGSGSATGGTGSGAASAAVTVDPLGTDPQSSSGDAQSPDANTDTGGGTQTDGPPATDPPTATPVVAPLATVSIGDASILEGDSGTRTISFPVTLSKPLSVSVSVSYAVTATTATGATKAVAGADFKLKTGTLTFTPTASGETGVEKAVGVIVAGDTAIEPDETFAVELSNPTGGLALARSVATGTILNDDGIAEVPAAGNGSSSGPDSGSSSGSSSGTTSAASVITTGIGDVSVVQTATDTRPLVLAIPVFLSAKSASALTLGYSLSDGSAIWGAKADGVADYGGAQSGQLAFEAGNLVQRVNVKIWPRPGATADRTFTITLTASDGVSVVRAVGTVTILAG